MRPLPYSCPKHRIRNEQLYIRLNREWLRYPQAYFCRNNIHSLDDFEFELREDVIEESPSIEELLRNSDDTDDGEVIVPKVVG